MKNFLIKFKNIIQFFVSIIASREFAFVYCVFGTIAQTAHTYYLLDGISSLDGIWKIFQSILLSFFISSSLLYFTSISDSNDKSPSGQRVLKAVTLFMWLEIVINLYYYSKHIVIDAISNNQHPDFYQLGFGILIACIIPITIKLYSSQIRAKEWLELDSESTENKLQQNLELEKVKVEFMEKITDIAKTQNELANSFVTFKEEKESNFDLGTNPKEYINEMVNNTLNEKMSTINKNIEESFNKHSDLFAKQFENKLQMMVKNNTQTN